MKHKKRKYKRKRKSRRDFTSETYKNFRKTVALRDERECLICKYVDKKKTRGRVSVHHILPWRDAVEVRYEPNNGCILCWKHHKQITNQETLWEDLLDELVKKSEKAYIEKYNKSPYEKEE